MKATEVLDLLTVRLAERRFSDFLWGYTVQQFAVEPTCFALRNRGDIGDRIRMLMDYQSSDGFWPAADRGSPPGMWATAVAVNTLLELSPGNRPLRLALEALLNAKPQEAFWLYRLKFRTIDTHVRFDPGKYGWGWVEATISWVIPTSMALIAFERSRHLNLVPVIDLDRRLEIGYAMLFDRMCPGGGWNAGNSVVYNVALAPHIDASAIALSALRKHWRSPEVERSLSWLVSANCSSAYSLAWKILALRSYLGVQPDFRAIVERAREQMISLLKDPAQSADTATLALSILALRDDLNPFAFESV